MRPFLEINNYNHPKVKLHFSIQLILLTAPLHYGSLLLEFLRVISRVVPRVFASLHGQMRMDENLAESAGLVSVGLKRDKIEYF